MPDEVIIAVSYDHERGHYIGKHPDLPPVVALSLSGLRQRAASTLPGNAVVVLSLDEGARRERDTRRSGGPRRSFAGTSSLKTRKRIPARGSAGSSPPEHPRFIRLSAFAQDFAERTRQPETPRPPDMLLARADEVIE